MLGQACKNTMRNTDLQKKKSHKIYIMAILYEQEVIYLLPLNNILKLLWVLLLLFF